MSGLTLLFPLSPEVPPERRDPVEAKLDGMTAVLAHSGVRVRKLDCPLPRFQSYRRFLRESWSTGDPFLTQDSDVEAEVSDYLRMLHCPEPLCASPYEVHRLAPGASRSGSCSFGGCRPSPGAWDASGSPSLYGSEEAWGTTLAFVKFGAEVQRSVRWSLPDEPGPVDGRLWEMVRRDWKRPLHLHWPVGRPMLRHHRGSCVGQSPGVNA